MSDDERRETMKAIFGYDPLPPRESPTGELRWLVPKDGRPGWGFGTVLQQRWHIIHENEAGKLIGSHEWRDVPTADEPTNDH